MILLLAKLVVGSVALMFGCITVALWIDRAVSGSGGDSVE